MDVKVLDFKYYIDMFADSIRNDVLNNISDESTKSEILSFIDSAVITVCDTYYADLKNESVSQTE